LLELADGVLVAVGVTCTLPTPFPVSPICSAAPCDRSSERPRTNGPRSLIRTTTDLPVSGFLTLTCEPSGSILDAAVIPSGLKLSPLLVRRPAKPGPYHEATSVCDDAL